MTAGWQEAAAPGALPRRAAAQLFFGFAFAYFLSALLRGVTATLAPAFSADLGLGAADLGLLAGAYFIGFALPQLPLGSALDRYGPRRVLLALLAVAVLACAAFAVARGFGELVAARTFIGAGVSACLMAALTSFRHRFSVQAQMRANFWMLTTGSVGMLASTLPVQLLLPWLGWRGLFWVVAALLLAAMAVITRTVPEDAPRPIALGVPAGGYGAIVRHRIFLRLLPLGVFNYGGLIAVQSLWAGPWLTDVAGQTPDEAARGLFLVNLSMLVAFMAWGAAMPRLVHRGWTALRLMALGLPLSLLLLALAIALGPRAGAPAWAAWCVASTFVSLSQPAVGLLFPPALAGRALSAYNLAIFVGIFCVQWGMGLAIDALRAVGFGTLPAYRAAFALFGLACLLSYAWFLGGRERARPGDLP